MRKKAISRTAKAVILVTGVFLASASVVGATERNRFESFRDQLVSYRIDTDYEDGSPRFLWLGEPSTVELTIGSVEVAGLVSVSPDGYVSTADFTGLHEIDTPAGVVSSSGVTFFDNGTLQIVHTGDAQPLGDP